MNIGICLGDIAGVGPEIVVKALVSDKIHLDVRFKIIGDPGIVNATCRRLGLKLKASVEDCKHPVKLEQIPFAKVDERASKAAAAWIRHGTKLCASGELSALVTAPVSKEGLKIAGVDAPGQTEWLARLTKSKRVAMMLVGGRLRVSLVTTHLALSKVSQAITRRKIFDVIELTNDALPRFGLKTRRIGVAALNPHAGEGGMFGTEEKRVIAPAIEEARARGFNVDGPIPADTLFHRAYEDEFDAVVAMYHDQGLAPLKMLAFDTGVNVTLGLPFIRTSPDHGTAYDIAGKGVANPRSMIEAINLAVRLSARVRKH